MLAEILNTGTYGPYIWGSFALALAVHLWNWLAPRRRRAEVLSELLDA
jgi:heme exporter protein CcmD